MKIAKNFSELIGNTPMLELCKIEEELSLEAKIFAKLEGLNPGGSIKDRVACSMIDEAEKNGMLKPNSLIVEPTSGNTGIGLAAVAAERGYRCIIIMPDTMSIERRAVLKALGAELILIDGALGMTGCIAKAKELLEENPGSFMPAQFKNPANPLAHILTTGPEMVEQTDGKIDIFVAGSGTGGTVSGCGKYLKEHVPGVKIVAVEPANSPLLSGKGQPENTRFRESAPTIFRITLIFPLLTKLFPFPTKMRINTEE